MQASEMRFLLKIKEVLCLIKFVTLRSDNPLSSTRVFLPSERSKIQIFDGLSMCAKCLKDDFSNLTSYAKINEKSPVGRQQAR